MLLYLYTNQLGISENIMSIIFITENPIMTNEAIKAQKSLMKRVLDEIKNDMQASHFDSNNSVWNGGEYTDGSCGYGVENYGEWAADVIDDNGNQEYFLRADEVCFIDKLMQEYNVKYTTLNCVWQEDSANMITIMVGAKTI